MRTSMIMAGVALAAATLSFATPALATNNVSVVTTACDSLTDGDAAGCKFTGNITASGTFDYKNGNVDTAYNAFAASKTPPPNWAPISLASLTNLGDFDSSGSNSYITLTGANGAYDFTLAAGVNLAYIAVKSGNDFMLYQYNGVNSFTTDGLQMGNNQGLPGLSHVLFLGTVGGVPEPATWAMLLLGVGMIGSSMRRRRKQTAQVVLA